MLSGFACLFILISLLSSVYANNVADEALNPADNVKLPIIMYHSFLKNVSRQNDYILSPLNFENDLKYLKENGYKAISLSELVAFVYDNAPLPEKPVMITFDDGFMNNLTYALPLLKQYDMKAVVSVVGEYSENYSDNEDHNLNYAYLTWDEISEIASSGCVEIGNHSFSMHRCNGRKGVARKKGETLDVYQHILEEDISKLQEILFEKCGLKPMVFTYPFGLINKSSYDVIKRMGFKASFSCKERVNVITHDPECLYYLGRFNRSGNIGTDKFMKKILA